MKRRPQPLQDPALTQQKPVKDHTGEIGLVLSGGGSRAAYQVGALKALVNYFKLNKSPISVVIGSSIGAINGLILGACLKNGIQDAVEELESMWLERNFRNTFKGTPSQAFLRAIKMACVQYMSPGPNPTNASIFDPTPLMERVDNLIQSKGGLTSDQRAKHLKAVAVMTTVEGKERKPLLFVSAHSKIEPEIMLGASFETCYVDSLSAKHGFASAALPSVLPPVELDTEGGKVRLVDGGISINVPVDPAVRLGADRIIVIDISGRSWWLDHYGEPHDTRPKWEVPSGNDTFCLRPPDTFVIKPKLSLGPILKHSVSGSTRKFITAVGPTWPVFTLLKQKMGEDLAFEVMSYVALDTDYIHGLIEAGYSDATKLLTSATEIKFEHNASYKQLVSDIVEKEE